MQWRIAEEPGGEPMPAAAAGAVGSLFDGPTAGALQSLSGAEVSALRAAPWAAEPGSSAAASSLSEGAPLKVPRAFVELTEAAALHHDPGRHALLYKLLWRLQHEPGLRSDPLDPEWLRAEHMAEAVRRELHKMKAFVRFRPVAGGAQERPLHVAWFEPEHHIVEAVAPFFVQRFAQLRWALLTPLRSVTWDGEALVFGPGARPDAAPPADAGEALWLTYYESIFNPSRLKLAMMQKEMPKRFWKNLPEAALIGPLAAQANARSQQMIEQAPTAPAPAARAAQAANASRPTAHLPERLGADADPRQRAAALAATRAAALACTHCPLYRDATQTVFGEGAVGAQIMFVGEQPGDQEDLRGRPFVGPSGALFEQALATLGIRRADVYVSNVVKHFKFELRGKRRIHKTPSQQEAAVCIDWLEREIALVQPRGVVALGGTAARSLLQRDVGVLRERGRWLARRDGLKVLVTLHPSALLRLPDGERAAAFDRWLQDLAEVKALGAPPEAAAPTATS